MSLPYFFADRLPSAPQKIELDEDTSRHIIQVLRMQVGEKLKLTDGKGHTAEGVITSAHKKHSEINLYSFETLATGFPKLTIAISLIKNASRFEWFLEKATEFGTTEIIPLLCERTERQKFRHDRMMGICRSAMLQSLQSWLPVLHEPQLFTNVVSNAKHQQKMIAHCAKDHKRAFSSLYNPALDTHIILIGPEGDFSTTEIANALDHNFLAVSLGDTRLRAETAGIFAASWVSGAKEREE